MRIPSRRKKSRQTPRTIAIAKQLIRYNIIGLSEVAKPEFYEQAISENWPDRYAFIRGMTGRTPVALVADDSGFGLSILCSFSDF